MRTCLSSSRLSKAKHSQREYERSIMKNTKLLLVLLLFLMTGKVMAQEPTVKSLMSKDLTEIPGKVPGVSG